MSGPKYEFDQALGLARLVGMEENADPEVVRAKFNLMVEIGGVDLEKLQQGIAAALVDANKNNETLLKIAFPVEKDRKQFYQLCELIEKNAGASRSLSRLSMTRLSQQLEATEKTVQKEKKQLNDLCMQAATQHLKQAETNEDAWGDGYDGNPRIANSTININNTREFFQRATPSPSSQASTPMSKPTSKPSTPPGTLKAEQGDSVRNMLEKRLNSPTPSIPPASPASTSEPATPTNTPTSPAAKPKNTEVVNLVELMKTAEEKVNKVEQPEHETLELELIFANMQEKIALAKELMNNNSERLKDSQIIEAANSVTQAAGEYFLKAMVVKQGLGNDPDTLLEEDATSRINALRKKVTNANDSELNKLFEKAKRLLLHAKLSAEESDDESDSDGSDNNIAKFEAAIKLAKEIDAKLKTMAKEVKRGNVAADGNHGELQRVLLLRQESSRQALNETVQKSEAETNHIATTGSVEQQSQDLSSNVENTRTPGVEQLHAEVKTQIAALEEFARATPDNIKVPKTISEVRETASKLIAEVYSQAELSEQDEKEITRLIGRISALSGIESKEEYNQTVLQIAGGLNALSGHGENVEQIVEKFVDALQALSYARNLEFSLSSNLVAEVPTVDNAQLTSIATLNIGELTELTRGAGEDDKAFATRINNSLREARKAASDILVLYTKNDELQDIVAGITDLNDRSYLFNVKLPEREKQKEVLSNSLREKIAILPNSPAKRDINIAFDAATMAARKEIEFDAVLATVRPAAYTPPVVVLQQESAKTLVARMAELNAARDAQVNHVVISPTDRINPEAAAAARAALLARFPGSKASPQLPDTTEVPPTVQAQQEVISDPDAEQIAKFVRTLNQNFPKEALQAMLAKQHEIDEAIAGGESHVEILSKIAELIKEMVVADPNQMLHGELSVFLDEVEEMRKRLEPPLISRLESAASALTDPSDFIHMWVQKAVEAVVKLQGLMARKTTVPKTNQKAVIAEVNAAAENIAIGLRAANKSGLEENEGQVSAVLQVCAQVLTLAEKKWGLNGSDQALGYSPVRPESTSQSPPLTPISISTLSTDTDVFQEILGKITVAVRTLDNQNFSIPIYDILSSATNAQIRVADGQIKILQDIDSHLETLLESENRPVGEDFAKLTTIWKEVRDLEARLAPESPDTAFAIPTRSISRLSVASESPTLNTAETEAFLEIISKISGVVEGLGNEEDITKITTTLFGTLDKNLLDTNVQLTSLRSLKVDLEHILFESKNKPTGGVSKKLYDILQDIRHLQSKLAPDQFPQSVAGRTNVLLEALQEQVKKLEEVKNAFIILMTSPNAETMSVEDNRIEINKVEQAVSLVTRARNDADNAFEQGYGVEIPKDTLDGLNNSKGLAKYAVALVMESLPWNPSYGGDNLCGFSSFVLAINAAILHPELFYQGGKIPENAVKFMAIYKNKLLAKYGSEAAVLNLFAISDPIKVQTECAQSLKEAFAEYVKQDTSSNSPFARKFGAGCIGFLKPELDPTMAAGLEHDRELIEPFIVNNKVEFNKAYDAWRKAEPTAGPDESSKFYQFLETTPKYKKLINGARDAYCAGLAGTAYMAQADELIYMAGAFGFRSIAINSVENTSTFPLDENGKVDILLKNRGHHWVAAPVTLAPQQQLHDETASQFSMLSQTVNHSATIDTLRNALGMTKLSKGTIELDMLKELEKRMDGLQEAVQELLKNPRAGMVGAHQQIMNSAENLVAIFDKVEGVYNTVGEDNHSKKIRELMQDLSIFFDQLLESLNINQSKLLELERNKTPLVERRVVYPSDASTAASSQPPTITNPVPPKPRVNVASQQSPPPKQNVVNGTSSQQPPKPRVLVQSPSSNDSGSVESNKPSNSPRHSIYSSNSEDEKHTIFFRSDAESPRSSQQSLPPRKPTLDPEDDASSQQPPFESPRSLRQLQSRSSSPRNSTSPNDFLPGQPSYSPRQSIYSSNSEDGQQSFRPAPESPRSLQQSPPPSPPPPPPRKPSVIKKASSVVESDDASLQQSQTHSDSRSPRLSIDSQEEDNPRFSPSNSFSESERATLLRSEVETGRGVDLHQILKDGCTEGSTYWFKAGNPEFLEILIKEKGATKEAPGESILKVSKPEVLPATGNSKYHCEIPPEQSKEGLKFLFERMKDSPKGTKMTLGSLITKGDAQEVLNQYLAAFCNPKTHVIETNIKIDFQDDGSKDEFFKALSKMVDEAFVKGASNPVLDNKAMEILQLGIHFGVGHKDPTVTNKRGGIFGSRHPQSPIRIGVVDPSVVATSSKEQYSQNQNTFPPDYTPKRTGILGFGRRH